MKKIVLDTSFLVDSIKFKIDLEEIDKLVSQPYKLLTINSVIKELEKLSAKEGRDSKNAKIALKLVKSKRIKILKSKVLKSKGSTDKAIIKLSDKKTIVATDDRELRKKLKNLGIKTIYLRAKKKIGIS